MESKRIYLPIETTKRELISRMSFAIESAKAGWEPVFASKSDFLTKIKFLKSGHYIGKSLQPGNYKHYIKIKSFGNLLSAFDEEGLFSFDEEFSNRRIGEQNFKIIENFFLWGEENKKELLSRFKDIENKLILSGNQRIELLKNPTIDYFVKNGEKIKKRFGNFILVTTKYTKTNFIKRPDLQNFVEHQYKKGWLYNDHLMECAKKALSHEEKNFIELINFLKKFSKENNKETIIIRPHPNEDYATYEKAFENFKNIKIIVDHENTNNWIAACKFLIHFNCTTGLEAFLLKKRSFNFLPHKDDSVEFQLLKEISEVIRSPDDINLINSNFNETIPFYDEKLDKLEKYIYNIKNNNFAKVVLNKLKEKPIYEKNKDKYTNFIFFNLIKLRLLFYNLNKKEISSFEKRSLQKLTPFNKKDVMEIYHDLIDSMKINKKDLIIKEIFPRMFLIKKS